MIDKNSKSYLVTDQVLLWWSHRQKTVTKHRPVDSVSTIYIYIYIYIYIAKVPGVNWEKIQATKSFTKNNSYIDFNKNLWI